MSSDPQLLLENQICFPLYAAHRLMTQHYQPLLEELGITYPQYLIMLVLWEKDNIKVTELCTRLHLSTSTITPLLKRLETKGLLSRGRDSQDERIVRIVLTPQGDDMRALARNIPFDLAKSFSSAISIDEAVFLKELLTRFIDSESSQQSKSQ